MSAAFIPITSQPWYTQAGCDGLDTEMWFPVGSNPPDPVARSVCLACPVRVDCLEFSIATRQAGVWGGMTEDERKAEMKRRQRRAAAVRAVA